MAISIAKPSQLSPKLTQILNIFNANPGVDITTAEVAAATNTLYSNAQSSLKILTLMGFLVQTAEKPCAFRSVPENDKKVGA